MKVMSWRRMDAELGVHRVVLHHHVLRGLRVQARERIERAAQHPRRQRRHVAQLQLGHVHALGRVDEPRHAGDLLRLVADALEVGDGLDHGDDEPQVAGGRLAPGDDVAARLVELDLHRVHAMIVSTTLSSSAMSPDPRAVDGALDLLFDEPAHLQHGGAHGLELVVELLGSVLGHRQWKLLIGMMNAECDRRIAAPFKAGSPCAPRRRCPAAAHRRRAARTGRWSPRPR